MLERRRFERIPASMELDYRLQGKKGPRRYALCKDLSLGGTRLCLTEDLPLGCLINLTIGIPDSFRDFLISGKVVWTKEAFSNGDEGKYFDAGIAFKKVNPIALGMVYGHFCRDRQG